ncbi:MAG: ATP-binding protein [Crenarchaeota archaeon]|nr:ATP-binding protein [Thermoproteota archaeon]
MSDGVVERFEELAKKYAERKRVMEELLKLYVRNLEGFRKIGFVDFFEDVRGDEVPVSVPPDVWVELGPKEPDLFARGSYLLIADPRTASLILGRVKDVVRPKPMPVTSEASLSVNISFDDKHLVRHMRLMVQPVVSLHVGEEDARRVLKGEADALEVLEAGERSAPRAPPDQLSPAGVPRSEVIGKILGFEGEVTFGSLGVLDQPLEGVRVSFSWSGVMVKHVLVTGTTGSGKTSFLKNLLWSAREALGEDLLQVIIDANGDFSIANFPGFVKGSKVTARVLKALKAYGVEGERGRPLPRGDPCRYRLDNVVVSTFLLTDQSVASEFFRSARKEVLEAVKDKLCRMRGLPEPARKEACGGSFQRALSYAPSLLYDLFVSDDLLAVELAKEISEIMSLRTLKALLEEAKETYRRLGAPYVVSASEEPREGLAEAEVRAGGCSFKLFATSRTFVFLTSDFSYLYDFNPFFTEAARAFLERTLADAVFEMESKRNVFKPSDLLDTKIMKEELSRIHGATATNIKTGFRNLDRAGVVLTSNVQLAELLGLYAFLPAGVSSQGLLDLVPETGGVVLDLGGATSRFQKSMAGYVLLDTLAKGIEGFGRAKYAAVAIDEAHLFFPSSDERERYGAKLESMIERLLRLGRRRGVGVILSTHRPSDLSQLALSLTNTKVYFRNDERTVEGLKLPKELAEALPRFEDYAAVVESYSVLGGFVTVVNGPALVGHKTV